MKKILLASVLFSFLVFPVVGLAGLVAPAEGIPETITGAADIINIIDNLANWLFAILLAIAMVFIILAAFQFLTSGGDPARVTSARQSLMYALVGIAIAFLARGLVFLVRFVLGIAA